MMVLHRETRDGFDIAYSTEPEYDDPAGHFASGDDELDAEVIRKINDGDYAWFVARVSASKEGVELGVAYLGACCYDSEESFAKESSDYYADMVDEAISEAKQKLAVLCSCDEVPA